MTTYLDVLGRDSAHIRLHLQALRSLPSHFKVGSEWEPTAFLVNAAGSDWLELAMAACSKKAKFVVLTGLTALTEADYRQIKAVADKNHTLMLVDPLVVADPNWLEVRPLLKRASADLTLWDSNAIISADGGLPLSQVFGLQLDLLSSVVQEHFEIVCRSFSPTQHSVTLQAPSGQRAVISATITDGAASMIEIAGITPKARFQIQLPLLGGSKSGTYAVYGADGMSASSGKFSGYRRALWSGIANGNPDVLTSANFEAAMASGRRLRALSGGLSDHQ